MNFATAVACGGGLVCVCGPPGSGKTTQVLYFLSSNSSAMVVYQSSKSRPHHWSESLCRRLPPRPERMEKKQPQHALTELEVFAREGVSGSHELHVVLDDCDGLDEDDRRVIETTPSLRCGPTMVVFWIISQAPIHLEGCYRYIFLSAPDTGVVQSWLQDEGEDSTVISARVAFYQSKQPMMSSVAASDIRTLLKTVNDMGHLLPNNPNALQFSEAWKSLSVKIKDRVPSSVGSLLLESYSVQLLCVALFFCGCVPPQADSDVFNMDGSARNVISRSRTTSTWQCSQYVVHVRRAQKVYGAMCKMVSVAKMDSLVSPREVLHFLKNFLSWGMCSFLPNSSAELRVSIAASDASSVAENVGFRLASLIPVR